MSEEEVQEQMALMAATINTTVGGTAVNMQRDMGDFNVSVGGQAKWIALCWRKPVPHWEVFSPGSETGVEVDCRDLRAHPARELARLIEFITP